MRILYQHQTLADGAEGVHIREMVAAFERLGHEVRVSALVGSPSSPPSLRAALVSRLRRYLPDVAYEPLQLAHSLLNTAQFGRQIKDFLPHFVYKRHARYDFGPLLACRRAGVPIVLEVNSVYSSMNLRRFEKVTYPRLLERVERWIFHNATRIVAVSHPLAAEVVQLAPRANVVVMPNGVNPLRFRPAGNERTSLTPQLDGRVVVGFVGTLWKWHGLELLLHAIRDIGNKNVHLLVVGDGQMRGAMEELAEQLGIQEQVTFTGQVPHDDVPRYMAAMDVTVLPAEYRAHASPMKIIEYMAMAKPVIAPRLANIEDVVTDGKEGLLFPPDDGAALVACLQRLVREPELRKSLGREGRNRVERDLNWDNNAAKVLGMITG